MEKKTLYRNFVVYAAVEREKFLNELLFNCIALRSSFDHNPTNNHIRAVYEFGEWLVNGNATSADYTEQGTKFANNLQHAAHEALEEIRAGRTQHTDWQLTFSQYLLFNSICNVLEHVSICIVMSDFVQEATE